MSMGDELNIENFVDVARETDQRITKLAEDNKAVIIAFIAPFVPARVSPIHAKRAQIYFPEEFGMEKVLKELRSLNIKLSKLILVLHSPGGAISSSFKIAKMLRKNFTDITVIVPHIAASGGTLMALAGNRIVMGDISQLSPLDTQLTHAGSQVSAKNLIDSFNTLSNFFKDKHVSEVPYTYKALADKMDPILLEKWTRALNVTHKYAAEILVNTLISEAKKKNKTLDKKECDALAKIAEKMTGELVFGFDTHGDVIDYDVAIGVGLNVEPSSKHDACWNILGEWFGSYVLKSSDKHFIRYVASPTKPSILQKLKPKA